MTVQIERAEDQMTSGVDDGPLIPQLGGFLAAIGALLGLVSGARADSEAVNGYGIIAALPGSYWLAVALAVVATSILVWVDRVPTRIKPGGQDGVRRHAALVPTLWLLLLHTAPQLAHDHARMPAAWANVGFVRLLNDGDSSVAAGDPRMAWPGFYGAFVSPLARLDDGLVELVLRLWPTLITGGIAVVVGALARRAYPQMANIGTLAALMYILLAWTGNDFFSPGAVGALWFVSAIVVLESGYLHTSMAWSSQVPLLPRFSAAGGDRPIARSTPAFVVLLLLAFGAVVAHPLIPVLMALAFLVLGLYGRSVAWRLLIVTVVAYGAWFLVSAQPWWSAQSDGPIVGLQNLGAGFGLAPTAPATSASSDAHGLIENLRMYEAVGIGLFLAVSGLTMAADRFKGLRPAVPLVPLAATSLLVLALDGVEAMVPFALPMAAVLLGRLLGGLSRTTLSVLMALVVGLSAPLLVLARYGNESFEMTNASDREAVVAAYDRAGDDALIIADNGHLAWLDKSLGRNAFALQQFETDGQWISSVRRLASDADRSRAIVVVTNSQDQWRTQATGERPGSLSDFARWLERQPGAEVVYSGEDAWTIEIGLEPGVSE